MKKFYQKYPLVVILTSIITTIIIGIVVLSALLLPKPKSSKQENYSLYTVKAQADNIFKGSVMAKSSTDYRENVALGELSQVNVSDGQEVKAGDILLTYTKLSDDLSSQEFAVKSAENDLANAQADVAEAEKKDAKLRTDFNKAKDDSERQSINAQIESNNEAWKAAQRSVTASILARDQAQVALSSQKEKQTATETSKTDGIVIMGTKSETSPLLSIVSRETLVQGKVSEYDYDKLKLDDMVTVETVDLSKKVTGKISYISPVPDKATSETSSSQYNFKVVLDEPLQNGYTVQIHRPNETLYIPKTSVKNGKVYMKRGGKFSKVAVETKESGSRLQVISGLNSGDKIIEEAAAYVDTP
ncbi:efflux RND transporter periplasmic adaptor subunit [Lactococcus chungangensis]|uniref:efflux RND transporter periplasmic adaptor subunit n=1 Tax=Pseudolactococcus chungangensis TaxID=451457 RepID=UPI0028D65FDE|nr:biotin/lipoyl-binding protein [Lactococcus chungangensis]